MCLTIKTRCLWWLLANLSLTIFGQTRIQRTAGPTSSPSSWSSSWSSPGLSPGHTKSHDQSPALTTRATSRCSCSFFSLSLGQSPWWLSLIIILSHHGQTLTFSSDTNISWHGTLKIDYTDVSRWTSSSPSSSLISSGFRAPPKTRWWGTQFFGTIFRIILWSLLSWSRIGIVMIVMIHIVNISFDSMIFLISELCSYDYRCSRWSSWRYSSFPGSPTPDASWSW